MNANIYIERIQYKESLNLAYEVEKLGIEVLGVYTDTDGNAEIVIDSHSYRDVDDVIALITAQGYYAEESIEPTRFK